ncbi:Sua5/YciO/YrdC/YwlC family protein [Candidatus Nomurabacteria bacterium]|nr:Sua5/YciO/YrdC/YwlC family protein [Candidatus Nomurabacteria bacterium]
MPQEKIQYRWDIDDPIKNQETVGVACTMLRQKGGAIVAPTKAGYIVMATDYEGLKRTFDLKLRNPNKPSVVLCTSAKQIFCLAKTTDKIERLYLECEVHNIRLGCILPWEKDNDPIIPDDGSRELMMDQRGTSCFVINFGNPSEEIARKMWQDHRKLCFASSANPSGQGNRGRLEGVGERILSGVDMTVEANSYVRDQQPDKDLSHRCKQGVMVSFINREGDLSDLRPKIIRKGLELDKIMLTMSGIFDNFDYRHGEYY